jgi:hypothetical protein
VVSHADYLGGYRADVRSRASILAALREILCTAAGQSRDWSRLRALFVPGASLTRTMTRGTAEHRETTSIDAFIEQSLPAPSSEAASASSPALRPVVETARPQHGVQLLHDGSRWWILTASWAVERPDALIPRGLLERN